MGWYSGVRIRRSERTKYTVVSRQTLQCHGTYCHSCTGSLIPLYITAWCAFNKDCYGFCFAVLALIDVIIVMYTVNQSPHISSCPPDCSAQSCYWSIQNWWCTQLELQMVTLESQVVCETKEFLWGWLGSPINNCSVCAPPSAPWNLQKVLQSSITLIHNQWVNLGGWV